MLLIRTFNKREKYLCEYSELCAKVSDNTFKFLNELSEKMLNSIKTSSYAHAQFNIKDYDSFRLLQLYFILNGYNPTLNIFEYPTVILELKQLPEIELSDNKRKLQEKFNPGE